MVAVLLRAEYIAIGVAGVVLWFAQGGALIWLLPALLAPDLSIAGYAAGPRIGAVVYNAVHNLVLALALVGMGFFIASTLLVLAGAILIAHIGMDRTSGFGLKYATSFQDTHLGRLGRAECRCGDPPRRGDDAGAAGRRGATARCGRRPRHRRSP